MEGKTDLRIVKTHKALSEAFLAMLEEKTFDEITVNELCKQAMVRRATFYKHFADKYDFFSFFIRQTRDGFIKEQHTYSKKEETPYSFYVFVFQSCLTFMKEHEKLIHNVLKSNALPSLLDILSNEIYQDVLLKLKEEQKEGVKYKVSPELMASFYAGGVIRVLQFWLLNQESISEKQMVMEVGTLLDSLDIAE